MAIAREKQIKRLSRGEKINIINNFNPGWEELFDKRSIIKTGNEKIL